MFDAAMSCGLGGGRIGRINKLRAGLKKLKEDTVNDALDRILNEMGYGSYLKKAEIGTSKIEILRILGNRLDSVEQLISRLSELEEIIKTRKIISIARLFFLLYIQVRDLSMILYI